MTLGRFYRSGAAFPKPEMRAVAKKRREKLDASAFRLARAFVRKRDHGRCRIPNCHNRGVHLHHIVFRSQSKRLRWLTENLVSVCVDHHRLIHAGEIRITGNADDEIIVTGNVDLLRFRL